MNVMNFDYETACDLCQEAFTRAYKSLATFVLEKPFKPWLMTICRNLAFDHKKELKKRNLSLLQQPAFTESSSEAVASRLDLRTAIQSLPERQKEVIEMHYFWDLTCLEIGEILSLPTGTVKSDLFLARKQLLISLEK